MPRRFTDDDFVHASFGSILDHVALKRLPQQTRLEVSGFNFAVVENHTGRHTLFDALAQAMIHGGKPSVDNVDEIHTETVDYILNEQWSLYKDIVKETIKNQTAKAKEVLTEPSRRHRGPGRMLRSITSWMATDILDPKEEYRTFTFSKQNHGSMIELCAAAQKFKFTFGILVFEPYKNAVHRMNEHDIDIKFMRIEREDFILHLHNCECPEIVNQAYVKYYFLQSTVDDGRYEWNYLDPIGGQFHQIPNGVYTPKFKRIISFHNNILYHANLARASDKPPESIMEPSNLTKYTSRLSRRNIGPNADEASSISIPIVLSHNGREFYYRQYKYDDYTLLSILNHSLFDMNTDRRLQIQLSIAINRVITGHFIEPKLQSLPRKVEKRLHEPNMYWRNYRENHQKFNIARIPTPLDLTDETVHQLYTENYQNMYKTFNIGGKHDLDMAASMFAFSYELFMLDCNMNWVHEKYKCPRNSKSKFNDSRQNVHLVLFAQVADCKPEKSLIKWYRLEPVPVSVSREDVQGFKNKNKNAGTSDQTDTDTSTKTEHSTPYGDSDTDTSDVDEKSRPNLWNMFRDKGHLSRKSPFKSIPILLQGQRPESKSVRGFLDWLKKIFHLEPSLATISTKAFLVPKEFSHEKHVHEIHPSLAKVLIGNVPWITSIPDSDYFMVTVNKNNPSSLLPILAYHTAEGNELENQFWSVTPPTTSSEESNSEVEETRSEPINHCEDGSSPKIDHDDSYDDLPDLETVPITDVAATEDEKPVSVTVAPDDDKAPDPETQLTLTLTDPSQRPQPQSQSYFYRALHQTTSALSRLSTGIGFRVRTLFVRRRQVHPKRPETILEESRSGFSHPAS